MKILFALLFCIGWILANSQTFKNECTENLVSYNTVELSNGYFLNYSANQVRKSLRLIGPGIDTMLRCKDSRASDSYLGILEADLGEYFVLSAGPADYFHHVEVYHKETGELLLQDRFLDMDISNGIIYFINTQKNCEFGIYTIDSRKIELFSPLDVSCLWWFECLVSKKLTDKELTLEYAGWDNKRLTKTYTREK